MKDEAGLQAVAEGINKFSDRYFKALTKINPGNLITSALSTQIVVTMAAYGAAGKTAIQMRSALKLPRDNELGQSGYKSLIKILNNEEDVELRLANKIYTSSSFKVKSTYKDITSQSFLSPSQELDFNNPVAAAEAMNNWCAEQTNNRITDVVSPASLPSDTLLILVNAVYFKGQWKKKFDPSLTKNRLFHVDENITKRVPTMFIEKQFVFGELPVMDARFIEIPYQGDNLSMIIILPNLINGLEKVVQNLHKVNLKHTVERIWPEHIELYLPKFRIENDLDLNPILKKLGMTTMFRAHRANFSGIADVPLNILGVIQTALIEVNEEGSEAFAYTRLRGGGGPPSTPPPPPLPFKVDRPFYFAIYHRDTAISLFAGIVQQPSTK